MAIKSVNSVKNSNANSVPESLTSIPTNNSSHQSTSNDFHDNTTVTIKLYHSFDEAKQACEQIYLKPGEAHTEFYIKDGEYHCVVAIGNIYENTEHLYLTDSGNTYSIDDRLDQISEQMVDLSKQFTYLSKDVSAMHTNVEEFESNVNNALEQIRHDIELFESNVTSQIGIIDSKVNDAISQVADISTRTSKQINDISTFVSNFETRLTNDESNIDTINTNINGIEEHLDKHDSSINDIIEKISSIDSSSHIIDEELTNINSSLNNIENILNTHDNDIADIKESISLSDSSIDQLINNVNDINSSINEVKDALETTVDEINEHLATLDSSVENAFNLISVNDSSIIKLAENASISNSSITSLTQQVDDNMSYVNTEIDNINSSLRDINETIDENNREIDEQFANINASINANAEHIENLVEDINRIDNKIDDINSSINDVKDALETNVDEINEHLATLDSSVNANITNIENISNNLSQVSDLLNTVNSSLNNLEIDLNDLSLDTNEKIGAINDLLELHDASINLNIEHIENIHDEISDINVSINEIKQLIGESTGNIDEKLENINASINDIHLVNNELRGDVDDINANIDIMNSSINSISDELHNSIETIGNHLIEIDLSIGDIKTQITEHSNDITNIINAISEINSSINNTNSRIDDVQDDIYDISILVDETNSYVRNIDTSIQIINASINEINNEIEAIKFDDIIIKQQLSKQNTSISDLNDYVNIIDTSILNILNNVSTLSEDINTLRNTLSLESRHNEVQDTSINTLDSSIQWIIETMRCKCADIQREIERNNIQDASIDLINRIIDDMQQEINELSPIDDASIYPLFHDDIYTINLCCYTRGGYIQINDYIAGYNAGGNSDRVAECTPFNEYKTYVHGDKVFFTAIPNTGYRFVCWYIDGNIDCPQYESTISYVFGDDINVIGTLLNGIDPEILQNGYTAKFKKLHRLKVSINQQTNNSETFVKFFGDSLEIYLTEPGASRKRINLEDAILGRVYYDDGTKIQITAKPDTTAFHVFDKFNIYDGSKTTVDTHTTYTSINTNTDLTVDAYFIEYWITVHGDAVQEYSGRVYINGEYQQISADNINYYLGGSQVTISAHSNQGYGFNRWSSNKPSLAQFKHDIIYPYDIYSNLIKMTVNQKVKEYELVAYFDSGVYVHYVEFYYNDSYRELYIRKQYNDGDVITEPEVAPTQYGYDLSGWVCEDPDYIINESTIDKDLRFYATWVPQVYDVSLYSKWDLYEHLQNVEYDTPFADLRIGIPENISVGETFIGWMADFSTTIIDPSTYRIQGNTRFDASILLNEYNVKFIVDDEIIQDSFVEYNTKLRDVAPAAPIIEGHTFVGWKINDEIVSRNWLIQEDSIFTAIYIINQYDTEFYVDDTIIKSETVDWSTLFVNIKPENPIKEGYVFEYWTLNDTDVSVLDSYQIEQDVSFRAKFKLNDI